MTKFIELVEISTDGSKTQSIMLNVSMISAVVCLEDGKSAIYLSQNFGNSNDKEQQPILSAEPHIEIRNRILAATK